MMDEMIGVCPVCGLEVEFMTSHVYDRNNDEIYHLICHQAKDRKKAGLRINSINIELIKGDKR
jgi:uncharacterized membrane protein